MTPRQYVISSLLQLGHRIPHSSQLLERIRRGTVSSMRISMLALTLQNIWRQQRQHQHATSVLAIQEQAEQQHNNEL